MHLTKKGLAELKTELKKLKEKKRPQVVARLANARSNGDLSENSDYHDAREELSMVDTRIAELEEVLHRAVVIDDSQAGASGAVILGSQVTVANKDQSIQYELVGEWEADPMSRKISDKSPLGAALLGKEAGDTIEVSAPAGSIVYKIVKIE